jgi:hypothetical protein
VVAWLLARLADDPQDASPSAAAAKVKEAVTFPLPRGRRYLLAFSVTLEALLISSVNLLGFKFITRF